MKLGDLGLSTTMVETHAQSVIGEIRDLGASLLPVIVLSAGTPEFMAPELFDEKYTEKVPSPDPYSPPDIEQDLANAKIRK